ncbi:MAG: hypothetical protein WC217_00210 [Candidatus Paceibacterota bacterium]|jgi:hypothetical protein
MEIGPTVLLPQPLQSNVINAIQGRGIAKVDAGELPADILWSRSFKPGQLCSLVQEENVSLTRLSLAGVVKLLYPVIANEIPGTREVSFEVAYSFGIADALAMMNKGGCVSRKKWHKNFDVRWIHDDSRAMIWYNTGDGYLPYLLSQEDCVATDWGVVVGFDKDRLIG